MEHKLERLLWFRGKLLILYIEFLTDNRQPLTVDKNHK